MSKEKHYFVCANSGIGFVNYFENILSQMDKIYILKAGPGTGKSTLMKKIGKIYKEQSYSIEYIHCSSDPDSLDGVIIVELKIAVVDGTAPHIIEPTIVGAVDEYVNLSEAFCVNKLEKYKDEIAMLQLEIKSCYNESYKYLKEAKKLHDKLEKYYINATDFSKIDKMGEEICTKISNKVIKISKE